MKTASAHITVCTRCGCTYQGLPALSRVDNETLICPDCGTREAQLTANGPFLASRKSAQFPGRCFVQKRDYRPWELTLFFD